MCKCRDKFDRIWTFPIFHYSAQESTELLMTMVWKICTRSSVDFLLFSLTWQIFLAFCCLIKIKKKCALGLPQNYAAQKEVFRLINCSCTYALKWSCTYICTNVLFQKHPKSCSQVYGRSVYASRNVMVPRRLGHFCKEK
jgi:hypothetical protein